MATPQNYRVKLLEKILRVPGTKSFRFSRPENYHFEAGQFMQLTIPAEEGPLTHAFSHADSPTEDFIEVTTRLTGSPYKNALDELLLGTAVEIKGPYGKFLFRPEVPKIAFLTGGIGITPVRSILRYLADTAGKGRVAGQEIVLLYASATVEGIVYREELEKLADTLPGVRLTHVISQPPEDWQGYRGRLSAEILHAELEEPRDWTYYIVGPPGMVEAMDKLLAELSVPPEQQIKEQFAGYGS